MDILKEMDYKAQVGPFVYSVTYRDDLKSLSESMGMTDADTQVIYLDSSLKTAPDRLATTLWHEIKHAVYDLAAMNANIGDNDNPTYEEEETVTRVSALEVDTLRRNPALAAFLVGVPLGFV